MPVGCEVEIVECNCLPDGRFHIEVMGVRRFRVGRCEEQDGYRLAHAEYTPSLLRIYQRQGTRVTLVGSGWLSYHHTAAR